MKNINYEQLSFIKTPIDAFLVTNFSADDFCKDIERKKLEEKYAKVLEITEKFNRQSVSYQLSKKDTLHSWLKYKEGFSANLVNILLDEMKATQTRRLDNGSIYGVWDNRLGMPNEWG